MSKVADAIQEGLESAAEARRIIEEISAVFEEFSGHVREATQGQTEVDWRRTYLLSRQDRKIGIALVPVKRARSSRTSPNLGTYELGADGYPVTLTFGAALPGQRKTETRSCADRQSLAEALADLLRTRHAGNTLQKLLPFAPPAKPPPPPERDLKRRTAWEVLGVPFGSSADAIRAAFKQRCLEYHPDRVAHLGERVRSVAEQEFQLIREARDTLLAEPKTPKRSA
jgi:hypothetical protein